MEEWAVGSVPDKPGNYLITNRFGQVQIAYCNPHHTEGNWFVEGKNLKDVRAWRRLPKPFRPETAQDGTTGMGL